MIGPGIARERECAIARDAARPRVPRPGPVVEWMPSASIVVAVVVALAVGAPTGPA
jgi:hypothetical protein